jgi:hypothetical protein
MQTNVKSVLTQAKLDLKSVRRSLRMLSKFDISTEAEGKNAVLLSMAGDIQRDLELLEFSLSLDNDLFVAGKVIL